MEIPLPWLAGVYCELAFQQRKLLILKNVLVLPTRIGNTSFYDIYSIFRYLQANNVFRSKLPLGGEVDVKLSKLLAVRLGQCGYYVCSLRTATRTTSGIPPRVVLRFQSL